jgi:dihydrofolate reductase
MISIIAVIGSKNELGYENKLIWDLPGDLKYFKAVTSEHTVIMGRKTFESIGFPLPKRKNIIITKDKKYTVKGCEIANSIQNLINKYQNSDEEVFIIGGGKIYTEFIPYSKKLYLTLVDDSPIADTFFPKYDEFQNKISESEIKKENGFKYKFIELIK